MPPTPVGPAKDVLTALPSSSKTPVSARIRERLQAKRAPYFANDNIAEHIQVGELEALQDEVAGKVEDLLQALVIDTTNDHNTQDTARRVAKMFVREVFAGRYTEAPPTTTFPNVRNIDELMIVGPITVRSACSHHLCPILGKLWVGVLPSEQSELIGLSKYVRLARWIMSRPQIQEEAIDQLADLLQDKLKPKGLALIMDADHMCMQWRGVEEHETHMTSSVMRGAFLDNPSLRREFLALKDSK